MMQAAGWWEGRLTEIAQHYEGVAGLIAHDFVGSGGHILAASTGVPAELFEKYKLIAKNHPWGPYMWSDPVGTLIIGENRETHPRIAEDRNADAFIETLLRYNIARGMGAILWKDRPAAPRWVIAVGILKSSSLTDSAVFSQDEQNGFLQLVPSLVEVAKRHRFVVELGAVDR